jgi:ribonuclease HI
VVAELRAGRTPNEKITLSLTVTIDPNATAEFNAALEALKKAK